MEFLTVRQARTTLARLVLEVCTSGRPVALTRYGRTIALLVRPPGEKNESAGPDPRQEIAGTGATANELASTAGPLDPPTWASSSPETEGGAG